MYTQVKVEAPPSYEAYLDVENNIDSPPAVDAPKQDLELKGMNDNRPEKRTSTAVAEEVRSNQVRLSGIYKTWRLKRNNVERYFGLSITIGQAGNVIKVEAHGIADKEFATHLEAAILLWSFSPVKEVKPIEFNLKHLDFLYRNELTVN